VKDGVRIIFWFVQKILSNESRICIFSNLTDVLVSNVTHVYLFVRVICGMISLNSVADQVAKTSRGLSERLYGTCFTSVNLESVMVLSGNHVYQK